MSLIKTYYQKWRILNGLRILPSINEGTGEGWKQYRGTGSGSPILQNGKLVGAVTHVLIDNPQMGYGIFAESMLE